MMCYICDGFKDVISVVGLRMLYLWWVEGCYICGGFRDVIYAEVKIQQMVHDLQNSIHCSLHLRDM